MNRLKFLMQPLVIFYLVVIYILASFTWWTFLHFRNAKEIKNLTIDAHHLQKALDKQNDEALKIESSVKFEDAERDFESKKYMILGEGVVFLMLLVFGCYKIHSGMRQEIFLNRQQRNFLLSITHELKSPIAGIKIAVQTLLARSTLEIKKRQMLLNNALKDTNRLQTLVENILMAAKIEGQSVHLAYENIDLSNIVEELHQKAKNGVGKSREVNFYIQPNIYVSGDRMALNSMIINLVENALKYSPKTALVEVNLEAVNGQAIIKVADTGIGIPDEEKAKIFKKFYRVGSEDTRKAKGTGLGLFIVKQLVASHKGSITIGDNKPRGTVFTIKLPCKVKKPVMNVSNEQAVV